MKKGQIRHIESILKNKKIKTCGIEIELSEEQLKPFEEMVNPKYSNPYERVKTFKEYYYIDKNIFGEFIAQPSQELNYNADNCHFENGDYYSNKELAEQVAMKMNLEQRLRKFTYENGWSEELWNDEFVNKWYIAYDYHDCEFGVNSSRLFKQQGTIYFVSEEVAQRAIEKVVKPFMAENPTFVW